MNFKLWTVASVALSLSVAAGCITTTNASSSGDAGGDPGGDGGGATTLGSGGAGGTPITSGGGGAAGGGTTESEGRKLYVSSVHPSLMTTCTTCHATGNNNAPAFMDMDALASYGKLDTYGGLITKPADSQILLHGAHTGPALLADQVTLVTDWLKLEAKERGLGDGTGSGGMPTITFEEALLQIGKCMDLQDWTNNNLDQLPKAQTANSGNCAGCHLKGQGGNWLELDPTNTFNMQKGVPFIKRWFTGEYENSKFKTLKPSPRQYLEAEAADACVVAQPGDICHPKYALSPTLKKGVDDFITLTLTRWMNKQCPP